jgi:signal peptidase I
MSKFLELLKKNLSFAVFVLCLLAFRWSFADQYLVPSGSMEPTIEVGDRIFVSKAAYHLKVPFTNFIAVKTAEPLRGDIVVFSQPKTGVCMVKRLIGLPGDHIQIDDGFISVNGQPLMGTEEGEDLFRSAVADEITYLEQVGEHRAVIKRTHSMSRPHRFDFVVPEDQYFMMGDNRDNSLDSRSWGLIQRADIRGRAIGVLANFHLDDEWNPRANFARFGHIFE